MASSQYHSTNKIASISPVPSPKSTIRDQIDTREGDLSISQEAVAQAPNPLSNQVSVYLIPWMTYACGRTRDRIETSLRES